MNDFSSCFCLVFELLFLIIYATYMYMYSNCDVYHICPNPSWYSVHKYYLDSYRTVLHVDPVILVVPDALNPQIVGASERMWNASEGFNVEALWDLPLALQD